MDIIICVESDFLSVFTETLFHNVQKFIYPGAI